MQREEQMELRKEPLTDEPVDSSSVDLSKWQPGDHIYVSTSFYWSRHAIYVGNDEVVAFPERSDNGAVVKMSIAEFAEGRTVKLVLYGIGMLAYLLGKGTAYPQRCRPAEETTRVALEAVGTDFGLYNYRNNNSEHFASYCKTGTKYSMMATFFGPIWPNKQI